MNARLIMFTLLLLIVVGCGGSDMKDTTATIGSAKPTDAQRAAREKNRSARAIRSQSTQQENRESLVVLKGNVEASHLPPDEWESLSSIDSLFVPSVQVAKGSLGRVLTEEQKTIRDRVREELENSELSDGATQALVNACVGKTPEQLSAQNTIRRIRRGLEQSAIETSGLAVGYGSLQTDFRLYPEATPTLTDIEATTDQWRRIHELELETRAVLRILSKVHKGADNPARADAELSVRHSFLKRLGSILNAEQIAFLSDAIPELQSAFSSGDLIGHWLKGVSLTTRQQEGIDLIRNKFGKAIDATASTPSSEIKQQLLQDMELVLTDEQFRIVQSNAGNTATRVDPQAGKSVSENESDESTRADDQ